MMQSSINGGDEVVLYEVPDGQIRLDVRLEHDTVWLTQAQMGELFGRERSVITKHVRSVFREGELEAKFSRCKFCTYCRGRQNLSGGSLQLRCCNSGGLPREI